MRWILGRVAVAATTAALVLFGPNVALASCTEPPPLPVAIADAETVFVGTVVDLDFDGRLATFDVIEVWKGELGENAIVNGGPGLQELTEARGRGEGVFSSVDRSFDNGATYLVLSHGSSGAILFDNDCSSTQTFTAELEALRPATVQAPTGTVTPAAEPPATLVTAPVSPADGRVGWVAAALIATALIGAVAFMVVAQRRRRYPPEIW